MNVMLASEYNIVSEYIVSDVHSGVKKIEILQSLCYFIFLIFIYFGLATWYFFVFVTNSVCW